jgi:two-component system, response regulator / RNA-binding antiterminator
MNRLNILLIESDPTCVFLEHALIAGGFKCLKSHYGPDFLELIKQITPDMVMFNLQSPSKKLLADLQAQQQLSAMPVIMFATDDNSDTIHQAIKAEVCAYLVNGLDAGRLDSIVSVAMARFKHTQALKQALEEACAKLEDRKLIDRAKAILIKTQNFTEDEAYHTLRKLAMDRHISLGEMAKNVLSMSELFK